MGSFLHNPATFHDKDQIRMSGCGETVSDQDGSAIAHIFPEAARPLRFGPGIHRAGWLIQHENRCGPVEGSGQGNAPPLAHAQVGAIKKPDAQL